MMKSVFLLIILSLFFVGCNSDEPKLAAIGNINSNSPTAPFISNVTAPAFKIYTAAEVLNFNVTFNKPVTVISTPRIGIVTDTGGLVANYVSGTGTNILSFSATIPAGMIDDNGIVLSQSINLNGGSIFDSTTNEDAILTFTPPLLWGIMINAGDPVITSITPPTNATYVTGQTVRFIVNFNARVCGSVTPRLALNVGGSTKYATWVNETCRTSMKFDYVVALGDTDADGIDLTGASINLTMIGSDFKDSFGDSANLTYPVGAAANYAGVLVSGVAAAPTITGKTVPSDKTYKKTDTLDFTITYNEAVTVSNATARIVLNVGGTTRYATYTGGSGTTTLSFRYTVPLNDTDSDGIQITSFDPQTAIIKNAANVAAPTPLPASWDSLANVKVDGVEPYELARSQPANGLRTVGQKIQYSITFSEPVFVIGSPLIDITLTTGLVSASLVSGSGTSTLVFEYTVQEGDEDLNNISTASSITFNGASIKDANGNLKNATTVPWPAHAVTVDAKNPSIVSANFVTGGAYHPGEIGTLQIIWSEPVTYTGTATASYSVDSGGTVTFTEGIKSANQIDLTYTVAGGKIDYDGITVSGNLSGMIGLTDGIGRTPSSLAIPASDKKIYFVQTEIAKWWDTSDPLTVGTSSTTLIQFKDLYAAFNGALTGTIALNTSPYAPPLKVATFTGTQAAKLGGNSLNYFVAVIDTTGTPSGPLLEVDSGTPTPYLRMDTGFYVADQCTIAGCFYRDSSGTWIPVNTVTKLMMTYPANNIQIIAVKFPSSFNNYRIGSTFTGGVHEVFFINATVNSETVITNLIQHLETKYGVSY